MLYSQQLHNIPPAGRGDRWTDRSSQGDRILSGRKGHFLGELWSAGKDTLGLQNSWEQPVLWDTCCSEGAEGKHRSAEQHLPFPKYPRRLQTRVKPERT